MSRDGSPPSSPIKPHGFESSSGTVTRSNPPFPLFIDDGQAPPEAYGVTSYTTRPPWMTDNGSVPDISGVTKNYVVDGASVSPWGDSVQATPKPIMAAEASPTVQPPAAPAPMPYVPVRAPHHAGLGALIRLMVLGVKLLPLLGVLVGGYYSYAYFFGPLPIVSRILHPGAAPVAPEKSRVETMMDQTRDVVARNNQRVNFANELATEGLALDTTKDSSSAKTSAPAAPTLNRATTIAGRPHAGAVAADRPVQIEGPDERVSIVTANQSAVPIAGTVSPSLSFLAWVRQIDVTGVRSGQSTRVIVDGVTYRLNDTVNFGLRIKFVGIDARNQRVLFRDATGAMVGKDYY